MTLSPLTALPRSPDPSPREPDEQAKLAEATRQFEAVLLRQILQQARQTVIRSKITEPSPGSDIYQDLVNTQMADAMSRSGGLGLAATLQRQLSRAPASRPPPTSTPAPQPPASHD